MQEIKGGLVDIKNWASSVESGAIDQSREASKLPVAFHHIAMMPDSHVGYGLPVGGVAALIDAISPNMVGVDIACGMVFARSSTKAEEVSVEIRKKIMGRIRELVPVGFNHHKEAQDKKWMPKLDVGPIAKVEYQSALHQVGTLGGGNHFLELQSDKEGYLCAMIHSGSRNIGLKIANYYNELAKTMSPEGNRDLCYLPIDSEEGRLYIQEMTYCTEFALASRKLMMERVISAINEFLPSATTFTPLLNIHHNYASLEEHFGKKVWVHRKGATSAREGELGIIPGSQGTKSYIVRGKGNPDSFQSCSHGAGRAMSRGAARKNLNLEEEIRKMDEMGIIHGIRGQQDLDEAASAYKNIDQVMADQTDLVDIVNTLTPLASIKG